MRHAAGLALGLALTVSASTAQAMVGAPLADARPAPPAVTKVEYYCSPGFEPSYGGTCVAVPSRAEIELFIDQPILDEPRVLHRVPHHRRHRSGLRERY